MRFVVASFLACFLTCLLAGAPARAVIIGHLEADGVESLPQSVLDAVGQQKWLFTHASVGANMIGGMQSLAAESPDRYQFGFETAGDWNQIYPPPAATEPGTIYDGARGNPGWSAKFAMFDDAVRTLGWRAPAIDIAMDKLCYIDTDADVGVYISTMTALEDDFPGTRFVYATMPLQSGAEMDWANVLAGNYNNAVRQHCAGGARLLLDIADIESHDPAGNPVTFIYGGEVYERLYSGYTTDGGHLNDLGARRVALGWYAAAASLAEGGLPAPDAPGAEPAGITGVRPNPAAAGAAVHFRNPETGPVDLAVFDARGCRVTTLIAGDRSEGGQTAIWPGTDASGRPAAAGVYYVRLRIGELASVRRLVVVK